MTKSTTRLAEVPPEGEEDRKTLLRKAYSNATQRLREGHKQEFQSLYAEEAKALGVEWTPRLTEAEKAEAQFEQLLIDYPHLREKVTAGQETAQEG